MTWTQRIAAALGLARKPARRSTQWPAAQISRLTNSWTTDPGSVNRAARWELRTLRARARDICRRDGYAQKFIGMVAQNVGGAHPFALQAKIRRPRGSLDSAANRTLEQAWADWSRAGNCDVAGVQSLCTLHRTVLRTLARDGEVLIRLHRGRQVGGAYGLRLEFLDVDRLDEDKNEVLSGGRVIKMGVELGASGERLAYHLLRTHPGEMGLWGSGGVKEYLRIPAGDMVHLFIPTDPEQVRGTPWMASALSRLWNLAGFEEAAVINARVGASKMGFYESPDGAPPDAIGSATDSQGRFLQDAEPGTFDVVPNGYRLSSWDPQFPDAAVEPFIRACLRGVAAALGVAYHSIAADPSNVNYSTARVSLLEERDQWSAIQTWYVEHFCQRLYDEWRTAAALAGMLPQEAGISPRWAAVQWQCKTWAWVDPLKDTQAEIAALDKGLTSRTRIAAQQGVDIEDVFAEIAEEQRLAEEMGIELDAEKEAAEPPEPTDPEPEDTEESEDDDEARHLRRVV